MTSVVETYEVTVRREKVVKTVCDGCHQEMPKLEPYETREFDLVFTKGDSYPEGASGKGWRVVDLCDDCANNLRQVLEHLGYHIEEIDW